MSWKEHLPGYSRAQQALDGFLSSTEAFELYTFSDPLRIYHSYLTRLALEEHPQSQQIRCYFEQLDNYKRFHLECEKHIRREDNTRIHTDKTVYLLNTAKNKEILLSTGVS